MSPSTSMMRSQVFAFCRGSPLIVPRQRITVTRQTIQNRRHVDDAIRAHEAEAVLPEAAQTHGNLGGRKISSCCTQGPLAFVTHPSNCTLGQPSFGIG